MQRKNSIMCFILVHIGLIFLQIHKQSYLVELSYAKQKNEKKKELLAQRKNELVQQWYQLQNRAAIKAYAAEKLLMKKIAMHQLKQLPA